MGADKLSCNTCGGGMEHDEGEGNLADGWDHFECLEALSKKMGGDDDYN